MARKIGSRYTITSVLGRGTCGTVWEGEGPDGPVAVKLLREDLAADQTLIARFVQERTALTSLHHPNVVGVRDLVVDGTDLALVMDLVRGSDLRHRLEADHALRPALAVSIVADVAEGLAAAHAQGIIHRDVKPENILLDNSTGALRARLADFGIARLVDGPRRTRATRIIGTPDYLAPEVIEGCQPGPPVDLYSLGTVLFELLTGWTPFGGGHPGAVLRRHVTEKVPVLPDVPGPLAALVASCLAKGPAARLTAAELAVRLRELVPLLTDMPPLAIPDPREGGWDVRASARASQHGGRTPTVNPIPMRHTGIVPLVHDEFRDDTRDTHLNLMRPIKDRDTGEIRRRSTYNDADGLRPLSRGGGAAGGRDGGRDLGRDGGRDLGRDLGRDGERDGGRDGRGGGAAKRPRWMAATAAALLVGGAAAAAAITMSGSDDKTQDGTGHSGTPAGSTTTTGGRPATTTRSAGGTIGVAGSAGTTALAFGAARELPPVPAAIQGAPRVAALKAANGHPVVYVFVTATDGTVWYLAGVDAHVWTPLRGLRALGAPAAVGTAPGRLEVFATDAADGQVRQRTLTGGSWSAKWQPVGDVRLTGAPAAAVGADGSVFLAWSGGASALVAVLGTPGGSGDLSWGGWAAAPGVGGIGPDVAAVGSGTGFTAYVTQVPDQGVLAVGYAGRAWASPVPVPLAGAPAAAATANGTPYVFVREPSGAVREASGGAGQAVSGGLDSALAPAAAATPDGKIVLVTAVSPAKLRVSYAG